jgi:glutamine amidotransferase-like uncharacterized protein
MSTTPAITTRTIAFALGQCLGPVLPGALADSASGVRAGLTMSPDSPCQW